MIQSLMEKYLLHNLCKKTALLGIITCGFSMGNIGLQIGTKCTFTQLSFITLCIQSLLHCALMSLWYVPGCFICWGYTNGWQTLSFAKKQLKGCGGFTQVNTQTNYKSMMEVIPKGIGECNKRIKLEGKKCLHIEDGISNLHIQDL